jgi:hypothetical protein
MAPEAGPLDQILPVVNALEAEGLQPVLVGGMALVTLGSQRITRDFDFLVSTRDLPANLVGLIYRHGYRLVTKLNAAGEVARTIDSSKVAAARLRMDQPRSAFFFDRKSGIRIDLLFDFPTPARDIAGRAARVATKSGVLRVASPEDLLRLKEISYADRKSAADGHDLEFLRRLLKAGS